MLVGMVHGIKLKDKKRINTSIDDYKFAASE